MGRRYAYLKGDVMRKATTPVLVAVVLILALAVGVNAQAVATNFTWVVTKLLTVTDTATFTDDVNVAGAMGVSGATTLTTLNATSNATIAGTLAVADQAAFSDEFYIIPQNAYTVTNGSTITVTGAVMELTAAGAVGADLPAATDGRLLILINGVNQTITITETASAVMAGNFAMGQGDTLKLIGNGVVWYELSRSNN